MLCPWFEASALFFVIADLCNATVLVCHSLCLCTVPSIRWNRCTSTAWNGSALIWIVLECYGLDLDRRIKL